jgi:hypothetical protein
MKPLNSYFNYEARYQFVNYLVYLNADIKPLNFYNIDMQFFISTVNSIIEFFILILKKSLESLFYLLNIKPTPTKFIFDFEGVPFPNQTEQESNEEKRDHILLMEKDKEKKTPNISDSQPRSRFAEDRAQRDRHEQLLYRRTHAALEDAKYL